MQTSDEVEKKIEQQASLLSEWKRKVEQLEVAKHMAEEKTRDLERRLQMILYSKSWKLTSPLRRVYDYINSTLQGAKREGWAPRYILSGPSASQTAEAAAVYEPNNHNLMQEINEDGKGESAAVLRKSLIESALRVKLKHFLSQSRATLLFPRFPEPLVSIIIPTFNKAEYLYQCLESILAHTDLAFEVIIVDDCSSDATEEFSMRVDNVQFVRNEVNSDFIRSCNRGAKIARGQYILFLNNDTIVTPRWLSNLVATMSSNPKVGAVGAKLVRPDGTLQEAGSIIWRDGSGFGYGRNDDPLKPEYCYLREASYCSGACLLVRAELFHQLKGFDELYLPAYYEEADLCVGIEQLGHKVIFQPLVTVFHYEYGSRSFGRAKLLMETNQPKFANKWADRLSNESCYGDVLRARDRRHGKRVLVMDDQIPLPYLGSGFPRAQKMLQFLAELGFVVTFVPLTTRTPHQPTTFQLQQLGIEVFYGDYFDSETLLESRKGFYDIVIISRPHNGARFLSLARQWFPRAQIVYDAEALYCLREIKKAELEGRPLSEREKEAILRQELDIMKEANLIITVSDAERESITALRNTYNVAVWGHTHALQTPMTRFSKRRDVLFVGGFDGGHPPNTDAVIHFASKILPRIHGKLPDCHFIIVGSQPSSQVQALSSRDVVVTGFVEDLKEYYEKCRLFVVPLRFGAGINYKLTEAMSYGIPAVVTTLTARGLDLRDGQEVLIAEDDDEFVNKVVQLYEDETLWSSVQHAAQHYIQQHCSPESMRKRLGSILGLAEDASS
ncbi:MAG TPA: glycosyltransferase [Bacteroidota bacterium]|nr:glycosyltransferase [Bacteroidota bacterium]